MLVLITYDVNTQNEAGRTRLRKVAKQCQNYGQRVQNSVFECVIDPAMLKELQNRLETIMNKEKDSIRFYIMGDEWKNRAIHIGAKPSLDILGPIIV